MGGQITHSWLASIEWWQFKIRVLVYFTLDQNFNKHLEENSLCPKTSWNMFIWEKNGILGGKTIPSKLMGSLINTKSDIVDKELDGSCWGGGCHCWEQSGCIYNDGFNISVSSCSITTAPRSSSRWLTCWYSRLHCCLFWSIGVQHLPSNPESKFDCKICFYKDETRSS